jgi:hypothetical protein
VPLWPGMMLVATPIFHLVGGGIYLVGGVRGGKRMCGRVRLGAPDPELALPLHHLDGVLRGRHELL